MSLRFGKSVPIRLDLDGNGEPDHTLRINFGRRIVNSISLRNDRLRAGYNSRTGVFGTLVRGWLHWR